MAPIRDIHQSAVNLWVHYKLGDKDFDPSAGIIVTLTDSVLPPSVSRPKDLVETCEVINQIKGWPALTDEEKHWIQVAGVRESLAAQSARGTVRGGIWLTYFYWIGYLLGFGALGVRFSWWIVGLLFATWTFKGTASVALRRERRNDLPAKASTAYIIISRLCLGALCAVSLETLVAHLTR